MEHSPQNIYNLFTVIENFLDNVYFQHCFIIPPGAIDLISIQMVVWIEFGNALIQVDQDHDHIALNINKVKFEIAQMQVDQ